MRKFTGEAIDASVVEKALEAAVWAPNSSNAQTWDFYWVRDPERKKKIIHACLNQVAARTCSELVVVSGNPTKWRRASPYLMEWAKRDGAPPIVMKYYTKLVPFVYRTGFLNSLGLVKWIASQAIGLFRPIIRNQCFRGDLERVAIKSAALASENLVLAIAAQDHDTCMMEGFDEVLVRRALGLTRRDRVVMVIAIGKAAGKGSWHQPFRIPNELVIHKV